MLDCSLLLRGAEENGRKRARKREKPGKGGRKGEKGELTIGEKGKRR
jgi:hypothetical protein